ncbi:MAG: hypothetical protein QXQ61_03485 [Candidatus Bathyarchaeia archaeon]
MTETKDPISELQKAKELGLISDEDVKRYAISYFNGLFTKPSYRSAAHTITAPQLPSSSKKVFFTFILMGVLATSLVSNYFLNINVQTLHVENSQLQSQISILLAEKTNLTSRISRLETSLNELSRYKLSRPTYEQLIRFLESDQTSSNRYVKDKYVCTHFARDLQSNAKQAGWNISYIVVNYRVTLSSGHVCNGVYLNDGRYFYIEPQTDKLYSSLSDLLSELTDAPPSTIVILNVSEVWP